MKFAKKWMLIVNLIGLGMVNNAFAEAPESFCDQFQPENNPSLAKFNSAEFNQQQTQGQRSFTLENGVQVLQISNGSYGYTQDITHSDHPYTCTFLYGIAEQLNYKRTWFYGVNVGIVTEYDGKGNIVSEVDSERNYDVNIAQLVEIMKQAFNINLLNKNQTMHVRRAYDLSGTIGAYYEIFTYADSTQSKLDAYVMNADTGEFLYLRKGLPVPNELKDLPSVFKMYLASRQPQ